MSTKTATLTSPGDLPTSPVPLQEFPAISPTLQQLWKDGKPGGSYGCVREVYHPLSPLAEPSAILYYESDGEDEDEDSAASSSLKPTLPQGLTSPLENTSPLARRRNGALGTRSGNISSPTKETSSSSHRRAMSEVKSPTGVSNLSRKRASQPNVSELFGIDSPMLHMAREEDKKAKRSKNDIFSGRKLNYGTSSSDSDENEGTGSDSSLEPDVEEVVCGTPGGSQKPKMSGSPKAATSPEAGSKQLQESPKLVSPGPSKQQHRSPTRKTPTRSFPKLPTTSPRRLPLPDSPEGSGLSSLVSSPSLSLESSPIRSPSPSLVRQGLEGKGRAAAHAEALANKLEILHIKAQAYSESITRPASDRKLARELDALFSKENRFDPREAALLEAEYQRKIRVVYERRLVEEQRQVELERQEQERIRAAEAARKAAEEQKRREEEELRRREQEELERKRKEEEAAKAQAEQQKKEAEAKRQAEEKVRLEQEAKAKAEKDQAVAAKALQDAEAARAVQATQTPHPAQPAAPQVYGRKSFETEAANVKRVITNLKELKKLDENFLKNSGLKQIRRELIPKFGQLNGVKEQTLAVRESIKGLLNQALAINGPPVHGSKYLFSPPAQEFPVPVTFLWIVNELAKMAVRQVLQECTSKADAADPIGVVIAAIFADPKYSPGGKSLIDIFIARFLKRNPILLGEDGPDATDADRARLGWKKDEAGETEREDAYAGRMQAYTAGYVAIAGRDFGKSALTNPYPSFNLWHVLASLLNKPADKLTNSHYFVVNTILHIGSRKLCSIYGHQARKLVEVAVGPWAQRGMQSGIAGAHAVQSTGLFLRKQPWWNAA